MSQSKPAELYPFGSYVDPADPNLPPPIEVWGWLNNFRTHVMEKETLGPESIPQAKGKVVVRVASNLSIEFDLAWGPANTPQSIRATYSIDLQQLQKD